MTEDQAEHLLAEALETYHRTKARGELPDEAAYRDRLGDLYPEFLELVAAETLIDRAIEPAAEDSHLPAAWGAYTLLEEIARGAAGVVYKAIHRKLGRTVALKVLRTGVDTDKNARQRFHREAQALAHVKHDNIVEIYEFGELDGRPYYAMSLVEGPSLMQLEKMGKRPSPHDLCRGLAGVADALATLHAQGIIHRDVKPQNIIVGGDGRYMLADFGLARSSLSETMTQSGDALGTPLYMSPEQMLGDRKAIEARSDIYGLGATMYQLLTGVPPFKTDNLHALMRMILKERPVDPRTVNPELPRGCARIALKCLEKESRDRYESAEALRADLLAFADGERVAGKPLGRPVRGIRRVRRHPVLAAAALVLIAVGVWALLKPPPPVDVQVMVIPREARIKVVGIDEDYRSASQVVTASLPANRTYTLEVAPPEGNDFAKREFEIDVGDRPPALPPILLPYKSAQGAAIRERQLNELAGRSFRRVETRRGHIQGPATELIYPVGRMHRSTVGPWLIRVGEEFGDAFEDGAWLTFRVGDRVLHAEAFPDPATDAVRGSLPAEATAALEVGDVVTWGLARTQGGIPVEGHAREFTVVDAGIDDELSRLMELSPPQEGDNPDIDRAYVRSILLAELFLENDLPAAAIQTLRPIAMADIAAQNAAEDAAEREGRPVREPTPRTTPHLLALLEQAHVAFLPKVQDRERSHAWGDVTSFWGRLTDEVEVPDVDPNTGAVRTDPDTGEPRTRSVPAREHFYDQAEQAARATARKLGGK